ncbi:hypothetical protein [Amycolatopsis sp. NPDC004079]|uniref:hypothetical protein n=1 Tax=Amycolatopsis sp. NPDC004079 TaxID=3154549 RepID=UPI0033B65C7C
MTEQRLIRDWARGTRQSFEVLEPHVGIDLRTVFGVPGGTLPGRGERFFARALRTEQPEGAR